MSIVDLPSCPPYRVLDCRHQPLAPEAGDEMVSCRQLEDVRFHDGPGSLPQRPRIPFDLDVTQRLQAPGERVDEEASWVDLHGDALQPRHRAIAHVTQGIESRSPVDRRRFLDRVEPMNIDSRRHLRLRIGLLLSARSVERRVSLDQSAVAAHAFDGLHASESLLEVHVVRPRYHAGLLVAHRNDDSNQRRRRRRAGLATDVPCWHSGGAAPWSTGPAPGSGTHWKASASCPARNHTEEQ